MSYISHINKYASSQAIQDALNAGTLKNPYVAMTPVGVLDYNTLEPAPVLKIAGQSITGTSAGGGVYEWNNLLNYSGTSFTIEVSNTPITAATWDYTEESLDQCGNPGTPVVDTGTSMSVFEANSGYIEWASYSRANNLVSYGSMDDQTSDDPADICECQGGCWDGETCQECDACMNWEEMGYESYEECRCSEYGDNCPEEPYMGVWTGKSFQITETDTTYWEQPVKIGVLNDVYMDGNQDSPDVVLSFTLLDEWNMMFASNMASNPVEHNFSELDPTWSTGVMTDPNESNSEINVEFDGVDTFTFTIADGFLTPINPEYPAGE